MHIPDNYLSPSTCAVMAAVAIPVVAVSIWRIKKTFPKNKIPLLGVGAAFCFMLMMFNVPVPGGTTAHAVGGALVAILLGPWEACISVTVALLIQAFMFGDGGILALGANVFNMAIVLPFAAYFIYKLFTKVIKNKAGSYVGCAVGGYIGINLAALCVSLELGLQPLLFHTASGAPLYAPYGFAITIPAMLIPHLAVVGPIEAIFTAAVVAFVNQTEKVSLSKKKKIGIGVFVALVALSPLGLLASGTAWGEWGADEIANVAANGQALGFVPQGMEHGFSYQTVFADYVFPGIPEWMGYILSAIVGIAILVIAFKLIGLLISHFSHKTAGQVKHV